MLPESCRKAAKTPIECKHFGRPFHIGEPVTAKLSLLVGFFDTIIEFTLKVLEKVIQTAVYVTLTL